MKIRRAENSGIVGRLSKEIDVSSGNVSPDTLVAVSGGVAFDDGLLENFDFFNIDQTSDDADAILLPAALPVGTKIAFFGLDVVEIGSEASSSIGINGGTDAQLVVLTAASVMKMEKLSATNWIANMYSSAGAVTAPTAS